MRTLTLVAVAVVTSPIAVVHSLAVAATAHSSQSGSYGPASNPADSTPVSPRVKHAANHKGVREGM